MRSVSKICTNDSEDHVSAQEKKIQQQTCTDRLLSLHVIQTVNWPLWLRIPNLDI